jgi:cell wall-associated NlpC family hydrolase
MITKKNTRDPLVFAPPVPADLSHFNKYLRLNYSPVPNSQLSVDCWQLVRLVAAQEFNKTLPEITPYDDARNLSLIERIIEIEKMEFQEVWIAEPGAIIVFKIFGVPVHVGIMIDQVRFIHAMPGFNVSIDRIDSAKWNRRIEGFYTWPT